MLSEKFTTCAQCGKKPPEVTSFTIGEQVLCPFCAPPKEEAKPRITGMVKPVKCLLVGGTWEGAQVEVSEIPPEQVFLGTPPVVYNFSRVVECVDGRLAIYTAHES